MTAYESYLALREGRRTAALDQGADVSPGQPPGQASVPYDPAEEADYLRDDWRCDL